MDWVSYGLAFLEGVGLIVSPCILPILPIVLSIGIEGSKGRPYGTIVGFVASFSALTLLSRQLITSLGVDLEVIRYISFGLLTLFAFILISDKLSDLFSQMTARFANLGERLSQKQSDQSGFGGGLILGVGIGAIWVPCAGPIMAAVIVQTVTQQTSIQTGITLISFSFGAAVPMLILVLMGRRIMEKVSVLKSSTHLIRKVLGVIILASVVYSAWPMQVQSFANPDQSKGVSSSSQMITNGVANPYPAPAIEGIDHWINSPSLKIKDLKGKVVLIDFWTYSCINCVRTLPYLKKWDKLYRDQGLVIIGVHAPEFAFEHNFQNVKQAVEHFQIQYPVALDNNFKTWQNFKNHYWPAHYLINKDSQVVYVHYGEGHYDVTESNIRVLLDMNKEVAPEPTFGAGGDLTPETYLGYERAERFAKPSTLIADQQIDYRASPDIPANHWSLEGPWTAQKQRIISESDQSKIKLHFKAQKVFLVMGSGGKILQAKVTLNGQPIGDAAGVDVKNGIVTITKDTLYELVSLSELSEGILEIQALQPDLEAYAFTFG